LQDKINYLNDYNKNPLYDYCYSDSDYKREEGKRAGQVEALEEVISLIKNNTMYW